MNRVLVAESIAAPAIQYLKQYCDVIIGRGAGFLAEDIKDCDAVIVRSAKVTEDIIANNSRLKVIAKHGMGLDNIDVKAASSHGVTVINAPFANLNSVAEHIVMLLLSLSKYTVLMDQFVRKGEFKQRDNFKMIELSGKTVGFIGMGKIPRKVAYKIRNFDLNLIAYDPFIKESELADLSVKCNDLNSVLEHSDFLIVHTPLTPQTRHLISISELKHMKKTAYLITACRGGVVNEQDLINALEENIIAGAGIDVFEPEPPLTNNPLLKMDNVILSPHNAALTATAFENMGMDCAQGIIDFLNGEKPKYLCN